MTHSDTLFTDVYYLFFKFLGYVGDLWALLNTPLSDLLADVDIPFFLDTFLGWIDNLLIWLIDSSYGDLTIIGFIFGSGLSLILVVSLSKFFFK